MTPLTQRRCCTNHCGALIPLGDRHGFLTHISWSDADPVWVEFNRQSLELADTIEAAKDDGSFDRSVPTSWIMRAFEYLVYVGWESVRAEDVTVEQAVSLAWRTLTSGLRESL